MKKQTLLLTLLLLNTPLTVSSDEPAETLQVPVAQQAQVNKKEQDAEPKQSRKSKSKKNVVVSQSDLDVKAPQQQAKKKRYLIDKIVARVNGNNLLLSDVTRPRIDKEGNPFLTREDYDAGNKQSIDEGLKLAVDEELLFQKAFERKLMPTEIDIEKQIVSFKAMQGLSHLTSDEFEKELALEGLTIDSYKAQLRRLMSVERLRHAEATERLVVTADEIEKYYHEHREFKQASFTFKIATFESSLFTSEPKKMELLRSPDISWEQFGPLQKSQIAEHLSFVYTMKKGEVSDPIRMGNAYQLVMLVDREEARYKTLDEQAMDAEKAVKEEKNTHYMKDFIEELRSQAIIVYF